MEGKRNFLNRLTDNRKGISRNDNSSVCLKIPTQYEDAEASGDNSNRKSGIVGGER